MMKGPFQCEAGLVCMQLRRPAAYRRLLHWQWSLPSANCGADGECIAAELCELPADVPEAGDADTGMSEAG